MPTPIDFLPPTVLPVGTVVDGAYRIEALLGEGGAAQVYKATHLALEAPVALKLLHPDVRTETLRQDLERRLWNEARAAARVQHPNVVRVREIKRDLTVEVAGAPMTLPIPYMVLDYLEGMTLGELLDAQGAMDAPRALPLFLGALQGLAVAHGLGIVHKDLKPDNLFVCQPGSASESLVVLDFGTARMTEKMTYEGRLPFTPAYVAPEYIQGHTVSTAVDVYQMGLVLVEMLSGEPVVPHEELVPTLMAHKLGKLDIPAWVLASPLGPIVRSATARDHTERIQSAAIFHKVLSRVDPAAVEAHRPRP